MKRWSLAAIALLVFGLTATWHSRDAAGQSEGGWVTLFDGKNLDNFTQIGDANWKLANGEVSADTGSGFLVSKQSYTDFQIRAEFWADDDANSGIYIRLSDPAKVTADNSYEVNIFDKRPDPAYGTGAIVDFARIHRMPKAAGRWNTFVITASGDRLIVKMNGETTVDIHNDRFASGTIALQYGSGVVKFRKVAIKPI